MSKSFAVVPTVNITRSKFLRKNQEKTTLKVGEITPIYIEEVIPGSTHSLTMASLIRMNTPVVPFMDNVHIDYYAFFCPMRLLWTHWKEFNGENTSGAGATDPTDYSIPTTNIGSSGHIGVGQLGDHLGLPILASSSSNVYVSDLPYRMYWLVYNEWFRDQNVESPKVISMGDIANLPASYATDLAVAYKDSDYFTRSLPYAQKGDAVTIPLTGAAPLTVTGSVQPFGGVLKLYNGDNDLISGASLIGTQNNDGGKVQALEHYLDDDLATAGDYISGSNLIVDLANATAATINDLRFAFQYQKVLERDALYGTRYWEILKGHFGIEAPDASLQRPENLGHIRTNISVDQVLQTSATEVGGTPLGNPGANSVTGSAYQNLFTKSFCEAGFIMVLAVARHDQSYSQGVDRFWTRSAREDFYLPEFANLGAQKVLNKEIFAGTSSDDKVFGYQEAWAEYRYKQNHITGCIRPTSGDSMASWTLGNNFASLPTLGTTFLKQGRENVGRVLVTGVASTFDFIADFAFIDTAVLPMPMYSIPGLIDHH